ncbi:MAG TPA: ABC transporter ATP-binding protein [Actinomycetota bacterium]|jgi:molybdate transport system ATP-binding protein|nr:ABC transporter ATP-binding protein [Actinomycetota bacterium]
MSFLDASVTVRRPRFQIQTELAVEEGHVLALIGPNGAGKSSLVEALCGLIPIDGGRVVVGGTAWEDVAGRVRLPPQQRSVGVMFQRLALFPKMTALDNVAYGPRSIGASRTQARHAATSVLERLEAADLAGVPAGELSGGQAQKVGLGRALAVEPDLLLLDEPTSQLDVATRMIVRRSLIDVLRDFTGVTVVVTHQPMEAMAVAGEIAVMEEGRITQRGDAKELQLRPRSAYVAEFAGVNLLEGCSTGDRVEIAGGASVAVANAPRGDVFVAIDPNAIALHRTIPEGTPRNVWQLGITDIDLEGDRARVRMTGELTLVAEITRAASTQLRLADKGRVWATTKATQVHVYPR